MKLDQSPDLCDEWIQATAMDRGNPAIHVEKDYWVTQALKRLSESEYCEAVFFKGGTLLGQAHGTIERLSEDIDLALRIGNDVADAKRRSLMKAIEPRPAGT